MASESFPPALLGQPSAMRLAYFVSKVVAHPRLQETHQAVVRCIFAYFNDVHQSKSPWMEVPLHTLMKLTPKAYGTQEKRFRADIPAVSTWRPKGSLARHQ